MVTGFEGEIEPPGPGTGVIVKVMGFPPVTYLISPLLYFAVSVSLFRVMLIISGLVEKSKPPVKHSATRNGRVNRNSSTMNTSRGPSQSRLDRSGHAKWLLYQIGQNWNQ